MKISRLRSLMLLLFGATACHHPPAHLVLPSGSGVVTLEVDSVQMPELATFPIRLKLTNYTHHKVVLVFDSSPNGHPDHDYQAKNLYLVAGQDTFLLGVKVSNKRLAFSENRATSFLCHGYFLRGEGHFDSFQQIDSVFKSGRLVYERTASGTRDIDLSEVVLPNDTLLLPTKLEAGTAHAFVGYDFSPASYTWREERLSQQ